jgi:hypothetical protein
MKYILDYRYVTKLFPVKHIPRTVTGGVFLLAGRKLCQGVVPTHTSKTEEYRVSLWSRYPVTWQNASQGFCHHTLLLMYRVLAICSWELSAV